MFHRHAFADHDELVLPHALGDGREISLRFEVPSLVLPIQVARVSAPRLKASRTGTQIVLALLDDISPISVVHASVCDHHLALDNWPATLEEWCLQPDRWPLVIACQDPDQDRWNQVRRHEDPPSGDDFDLLHGCPT